MAFALSDTPIQPNEAFPVEEDAGAIVCFEGRVRCTNEGRSVVGLEYTAYEALALKEGERIIAEAKTRYPILSVSIIHRTGLLKVGDLAVYVRVQSVHRAAAFDASVWLMDELKKRIPIWKREHYADAVKWL